MNHDFNRDLLAPLAFPYRDNRWNSERLSNEEIKVLGHTLVNSLDDVVAARVTEELRPDAPHIDGEQYAELWDEFAAAVAEIRVFGTLLYDTQASYLRAHLCLTSANAAA